MAERKKHKRDKQQSIKKTTQKPRKVRRGTDNTKEKRQTMMNKTLHRK
jgi:hypothetical protein